MMKPLKFPLALMLFVLCSSMAFAVSPAGLWTTVDDKTGEKRAVVNLVEKNGILTGTIAKVYPQPGDQGICVKCPNNFKDKPILGMQFLWGLKNRGDGVWDDGNILDARSSQIYRAKITVKGDKLYVRGYIGFALLGRTQVWVKESLK